jgi:hypothetical protein
METCQLDTLQSTEFQCMSVECRGKTLELTWIVLRYRPIYILFLLKG